MGTCFPKIRPYLRSVVGASHEMSGPRTLIDWLSFSSHQITDVLILRRYCKMLGEISEAMNRLKSSDTYYQRSNSKLVRLLVTNRGVISEFLSPKYSGTVTHHVTFKLARALHVQVLGRVTIQLVRASSCFALH